MLLQLLASRTRTDEDGQPFRWRGEGVSRIEGLRDTVFGFAITLLVVSLEVPKFAVYSVKFLFTGVHGRERRSTGPRGQRWCRASAVGT